MTAVRVVALVLVVVGLAAHPIAAQSLSKYRGYTLGSSVESVIKISGARKDDLKTLHEKPARIQEIEWRAPYVTAATVAADPVRNVIFTFHDDQLYRLVVTYEHDRMEGLTTADVVDSVSAAYGALPMHSTAAAGNRRVDMPADTTVVARWDDGASILTLVRSSYTSDFQLVLISKQLGTQARIAINEALRRDARDAPQRELDQRTRAIGEARMALEKARGVNKAAFKP